MTYSDFTELIKNLDFPSYEADFPKSVKNPIVVFQKGVDKNHVADGKLILSQQEVVLHLVTERKDVNSQPKLEAWLKGNEFLYKMSDRYWDRENNFYITEYRFFII
jgi:hypothetical protein